MKQLVVLFSALILISCNGFKLEGSAKGVKDGTKVYLVTADSTGGPKPKDTVEVKNETFAFEGEVDNLEYALVGIEGVNNGSIPLILESGNINLKFDIKEPYKSKIGGTENNDLLQAYNNLNISNQDKVMAFIKPYEGFLQQVQIKKQKNEKLTEDEEKQYALIVAEGKKFQAQNDKTSKDFIKKNEDKFVSVLLIENLFFNYKIDTKEVKAFYDKLSDDLKNTKSAISIKRELDLRIATEKKYPAPEKKKVNNTTKAANFSAKTPEGKIVSLKESLGKVTIIDFWASWCGPCRAENPNVVALYNELHSKGLNIIGVSLDEDATKWKNAIAKDKLTWTQISNLKGWQDPIALDYKVEGIPATFILDANGNIVAKNLRGDELKAKVKELLGVK